MSGPQVLREEEIKTMWTRHGGPGEPAAQADPDSTDPDTEDADGTDADTDGDSDGTDADTDTRDS